MPWAKAFKIDPRARFQDESVNLHKKTACGMSLQQHAQAVDSRKIVGATGLEPVTLSSEPVRNKGLSKDGETDANVYANTSTKNPLEKLAQAWETLTPEVQAKIAELVEKATEKA